jgi:hypothetical protein
MMVGQVLLSFLGFVAISVLILICSLTNEKAGKELIDVRSVV